MNDLRRIFSKENLTSKIGKLPVWLWGLILGVIVVAIYFLFIKKRGATVTSTDSLQTETDKNLNDTNDLNQQFADLYSGLSALPENSTPTTPPSSSNTGSSNGSGGRVIYSTAPKPISPTVELTANVGTIANPPRRTSGGSFAPTAPADPATQTHSPKLGQILPDTTKQSGTPKPLLTSKPKPKPVIPAPTKVPVSAGQKVAY